MIIRCLACQDQPSALANTCAACGGSRVGSMLGTTLVTVGSRFSPAMERVERLEHRARLVVRSIVFAGTIGGLIMSGGYILLLLASGTSLSQLSSEVPSSIGLLWWVAVLCSCLGFSSLSRQLEVRHRLPRPPRVSPGEERSEPVVTSLTQATNHLDAAEITLPAAKTLLFESYHLATNVNQPWRPAHFFLACVHQPAVQAMFIRLGVDPTALALKTEHALTKATAPSADLLTSFILSAVELGYIYRRDRLDVPLLCVAATQIDSVLQEVLLDSALDQEKLQNVLQWQWNDEALRARSRGHRFAFRSRPHNHLDRAMTAVATPVLDYFSQDLTERASAGALLPSASRPELTDALLRLLEVGHPVLLVGYPGVGKRGVIEDVAERMAADDVPSMFVDKRLVALSLPQLVGGVTPAEGQGRVLKALDEVSRSRNIVLVAEDLHGMVGLSAGQSGSVDLADVFARTVAERGVPMIATTTPEGYAQALKGTQVGSLFQVLEIPEPTPEQTIRIAEERLGVIEGERGIYFSYDALVRLVTLAQMLIHDQRFPQKVLSLLDELALFALGQHGKHHLISPAEVNAYMSSKLHLPLEEVTIDESSKLLNLETRLHERLIGQNEAVQTVAGALRRARAEVRDKKRPIASLLFLGPTGVGKTELAKSVAEAYFGNEQHMVRFDMTEYQELSSLSRLIGEASGGPQSQGVLTEAVRKNPYALLLLDEIEKAHHDIINVFLQVLDDGRLTDSQGEVVDFTNTIIIATSNAAANYIQDAVRQNVPAETMERALLEKELRSYFQPEFINRFDRVVVFRPLDASQVNAIAGIMLKKLAEGLAEQGITFTWSPEGLARLAAAGFDPVFGARPLRRVIQDQVDTELARLILAHELGRRDQVVLTPTGSLEVHKAPAL